MAFLLEIHEDEEAAGASANKIQTQVFSSSMKVLYIAYVTIFNEDLSEVLKSFVIIDFSQSSSGYFLRSLREFGHASIFKKLEISVI